MPSPALVITGSTGFVGKNLVPFLRRQGFRLILLQNRTVFPSEDDGIIQWQINNDWSELDKILLQYQPAGIIHLATRFIPSHTPEQIPDMIQSNVEFGTRVLDAAVRADIPWFINIGTFWQHYRKADYDPVNLYAATKQAFEAIALYYQNTSHLKFVTLCLNDTFGPGDTRKKIFPLWKYLADHPEEPMLMSPGEQLLDILYIDDVVAGIYHLLTMLTNNSPEISGQNRFYLTSDRLLSLRYTAEIFAKISGRNLNIRWGERPYRQREVMHPQCSGIKLPGWQPKVSLEEGIKKFLSGNDNE